MWSILRNGGPGHMTKMATMPILYGKYLKVSSSLEPVDRFQRNQGLWSTIIGIRHDLWLTLTEKLLTGTLNLKSNKNKQTNCLHPPICLSLAIPCWQLHCIFFLFFLLHVNARITIIEPSHEKTINLYMQKQRRRSAVQ